MNDQSTASLKILNVLAELNDIGASLSSEPDIEKLLDLILASAQSLTNADGGTLYLVMPDETLSFSIIHNNSLKIHMGGHNQPVINFPPIPLYLPNRRPNHNAIAAYCALNKIAVNISEAYEAIDFDFSGAKSFDEANQYKTRSVLAIPLINHQGKVLAVLQLINAKDALGHTIPFGTFQQKLAESLASQASISMQNRLLINQLQDLFEGLINLINTAIDEKSPYTGGHCIRVPELTLMLAEATSQTQSGPMASFKLTSKDRYELKIASMLHDCGKITTPVHVVDKATKLETISDRIGLIESRFANIRLAKLMEYQIQSLHQPENVGQLQEQLNLSLQKINDDLNFLKIANIGSERMKAEDIDRVHAIGLLKWTDAQGHEQPLLTDNEIKNLTIEKGTLTSDERKIINNHIVSTIKLLDQLPWPDHLQNVTEYAGGHHERMDGKGYPKGLKRQEMSVPARIMGIADVFEALTACDRPYKKAMSLSQSLAIMERMKEEQHIDPDLFDIFMEKRVYMDYAKKFLQPEQIDIHQGADV